jgi:hypothetical protein
VLNVNNKDCHFKDAAEVSRSEDYVAEDTHGDFQKLYLFKVYLTMMSVAQTV